MLKRSRRSSVPGASSQDLEPTDKLAHAIVLEAWDAYVRFVSPKLVQGFTLWVKEREPDVLRVINERTLAAIAKQITEGTLSNWGSKHSA